MLIDPKDLIGKTLKGTYEIDGIIGQGGMGIVYHARERHSSREVAIKVLLPKEALQIATSLYNEFFIRFRREAAVVARLRHPQIVSVYDTGLYDGMPFLVMPYLRGGTLHKKLRTNGPLSSYEALTYIEQIASAIDFIHRNGIVHRDIKTLNLMFDNHGHLVLTDFGIAHIFGSTLTKIGEFLGTFAYASPEAKQGEEAHHCDDIYSLGVVLYEMLTNNDPAMVHRSDPSIPSEVEAIIRKATADRREDRYASAGAMARALRVAVGRIHNAPTLVMSLPKAAERTFPPIFTGFRLLSIGIVLVAALMTWIAAPFIFSPAKQGPTPVEQARATVNQYYSYWNDGNYSAAYGLLGSDYRSKNPYAKLLPSYEHTHRACVTIDSATLQPDGSVDVQVTDNAIEDPPSGGRPVVNVYQVDFTVNQEQGQWKITRAQLNLIATNGVCQSP
jgi:serine/threonine protein kinase